MDQNNLNIPALIALVRKHQDYQGDKLKSLHTQYESIGAWIKADNIAKGPYPVKGGLLHRTYESWCKNNNYTQDQIAKNKPFHVIMKQTLHFRKSQKAVTYYLNRRIENDKKITATEEKKETE